jgi:hypothetical protein
MFGHILLSCIRAVIGRGSDMAGMLTDGVFVGEISLIGLTVVPTDALAQFMGTGDKESLSTSVIQGACFDSSIGRAYGQMIAHFAIRLCNEPDGAEEHSTSPWMNWSASWDMPAPPSRTLLHLSHRLLPDRIRMFGR